MSRRMSALLVAVVFAVVLVGLSAKARSGPTSRPNPAPTTAAEPTSNGPRAASSRQDLLQTVQQARDEVRKLRRDVEELRKMLATKPQSNPAQPATHSLQIYRVSKADFDDGDKKVMMLYLTPVAAENHPPLADDSPTADEILRSLPDGANALVAGLVNTERKNVRFVVDKIVEKTGECRFYPLVGNARLKTQHYKCMVSFEKAIRSDWPVPFTHVEPTQAVVYIDHDYLIPCSGTATSAPATQSK